MTSRPKVSGYEVNSLLGKGGMACVYRARQRSSGDKVAIKLPRLDIIGAKERAYREAEALRKIRSGHVLELRDDVETAQGHALVLPLLRGETLAARLAPGPLPPNVAAEYLRQAARGVAAAHKAGVIHRDLSPRNLFLVQRSSRPDLVKVLDFGLSVSLADVRLTPEGLAVGSLPGVSPEQRAGRPITPTTDTYSLGVILYECLTGSQLPDGLRQTWALMARPGAVPVSLWKIMERCLRPEPAARYSASELAAALKAYLADHGSRIDDAQTEPYPSASTRRARDSRAEVPPVTSDARMPRQRSLSSKLVLRASFALSLSLLVKVDVATNSNTPQQGAQPAAHEEPLPPVLPLSSPNVASECGSETVGGGFGVAHASQFLERSFPGCKVMQRSEDEVTRLWLAGPTQICPERMIEVHTPGSGHAFGPRCDMAQIRASSADYSAEDLAMLGCSGRQCVQLLGFDAIVWLVHRQTTSDRVAAPVTLVQLRASLYERSDGSRPCGRDELSGTTREMLAALGVQVAPGWKPSWDVRPTHAAIVQAVREGVCDGGFASYRAVGSAEVNLAPVAAPRSDGVPIAPTPASIALGRYPLVRRARWFRSELKLHASPFADALWASLDEPWAKALLRQYLVAPDLAPSTDRHLTQQLQVSLNFAEGRSDAFANRVDAEEDIDRLVDYLESRSRESELPRLSFRGYQDARNPGARPALAKERCRFVANAIARRIRERFATSHPLRKLNFSQEQFEDGSQSPARAAPGSADSRRVEVFELPDNQPEP